jgi:hypothetical protein
LKGIIPSLPRTRSGVWLRLGLVLALILAGAMIWAADSRAQPTSWEQAYQLAQQYGYTGTLEEFKACASGGWVGPCQYGPWSRVPLPQFGGNTTGSGGTGFTPGTGPPTPPPPPPPPSPSPE